MLVEVRELQIQLEEGSKGGMFTKVDKAKAYNCVEWSFIQEAILAAGFGTQMVGLIMSCISSTSLTILWNGERLEEFQPQCRLRQGDPFITPYLFVLSMEVLGQSKCACSALLPHLGKSFWKNSKKKELRDPSSPTLDTKILFQTCSYFESRDR